MPMSQSMAVRSSLPVASRSPPGENARQRTVFEWPFSGSNCLPFAASHTMVTLSSLTVAMRSPLGEKQAALIGFEWPANVGSAMVGSGLSGSLGCSRTAAAPVRFGGDSAGDDASLPSVAGSWVAASRPMPFARPQTRKPPTAAAASTTAAATKRGRRLLG